MGVYIIKNDGMAQVALKVNSETPWLRITQHLVGGKTEVAGASLSQDEIRLLIGALTDCLEPEPSCDHAAGICLIRDEGNRHE